MSAAASDRTSDGASVRVLVVEDAPEFLAVVVSLLRQEGFGVEQATVGEAAVGIARTGSPEVVVLDLDLLDVLSSNPRMAFTREKLLEKVWGPDWFGDDHVVDVHVSNLRKKIGDDPSSPHYIRTVRGVGYRMGGGS